MQNKTTINRFTSFVKSPSAPVFALGTMMLAFLTVYSKMYLGIIPTAYKIHPVIDIGTALIVGLGLCTITFIIIVHSKNKSMPTFFALGDFFGGALFYAKEFELYWSNSDYISIGQGLFFAIMKSAVLFYCADIFIKEVQQKEESNEQTNSEIQALQDRIDTLLKESIAKDKAIQDSKAEANDLKQAISSLNNDLSAKDSELTSQVSNLKNELRNTQGKYKALESDAKVWKLGFLEKVKADESKKSRNRNDDLINEYVLEIEELKKQLSL